MAEFIFVTNPTYKYVFDNNNIILVKRD